MTDLLVVFVDSLAYSAVKEWRLAQTVPHCLPFEPLLGYSVNVKPAMFAGLVPDACGEFCEWQFQPGGEEPNAAAMHAYRAIDKSPLVRSLFDRGVAKLRHREACRIPWSMRHHFKRASKLDRQVYEPGFRFPSVLDAMDRVIYPSFSYGPDRDSKVFGSAHEQIGKSQRLFVGSADLDGLTHKYGIGSPEYIAKVSEVEALVTGLYTAFKEHNPEGKFFLTSDHGMAPVTTPVDGVSLPFDLPAETTFFTDSTFLRVWNAPSSVAADLEAWTVGRVLSPEERRSYNLASPAFGDFIFLLNEGHVFAPSFVSRRPARAMHGYAPELPSQWGIVLASHLHEKEDRINPALLHRNLLWASAPA